MSITWIRAIHLLVRGIRVKIEYARVTCGKQITFNLR